jgi:hypothetical protein
MSSSSSSFPQGSDVDTDRHDALRAHLAGWIPRESTEKNPTYVRLVQLVLERDDLFELASRVPAPQLPANVLFASVHFLLLNGADHDLALHYATVRESRGLTAQPIHSLEDDFIDFTRTVADELDVLLNTGITQTNEVGRSAILGALLGDLTREGIDEVALFDVGCSAGLNLFVDAFRIDHAANCTTGPADSPVHLAPVHHGRIPHSRLPAIVSRTGLDQHPLDPSDLRDSTWLEACLWPDDPRRFARLHAAIRVASHHRASFQLHTGDLAHDIATIGATIPGDTPLVVFSSWAAAYLPTGTHSQMTHSIDELARNRKVIWLACEHPAVAGALGLVDAGYRTRWPGASLLTTRVCGEGASTTVFGEAHPHAEWISLS